MSKGRINDFYTQYENLVSKFEEQKRISIVFKKLQELLDVQKILLNQYSKQKQCLLRQMFI